LLKKSGPIFKNPQFVKARQHRYVVVLVYLTQNLRLRGRPPPIIFAL